MSEVTISIAPLWVAPCLTTSLAARTRPLSLARFSSVMVPMQWMQSPLLRESVRPIRVREVLPAPPICLVRRGGMPLTPAAEYFCDMMRRAALHMDSLAIDLRN